MLYFYDCSASKVLEVSINLVRPRVLADRNAGKEAATKEKEEKVAEKL